MVSAVDANTVFLSTSEAILEGLRGRGWKLYTFIGGAARFMFAWDTNLKRVDALLGDLEECAGGKIAVGAASSEVTAQERRGAQRAARGLGQPRHAPADHLAHAR